MNAEIKKKWVEALRSGKYKQGTKALNNTLGRFCCLGVLCDLHRKKMKKGEKWKANTEGIFEYLGADKLLPIQVEKWADFKSSSEVTIEGVKDYLTKYNDTGRSFEEIATAIEEQL